MLKLKALKDLAFKKLGISTTGAIHEVGVTEWQFKLYQNGRRNVLVEPGGNTYKLGDIVRIIEVSPTGIRFGRHELHFFVKDIVTLHHDENVFWEIITLE